MNLIARAYHLRLEARQALQEGDFERARKLASEAETLCSTSKGEDLRLLSSWLLGSFELQHHLGDEASPV